MSGGKQSMNKASILGKLREIIYPNFKRDIVDFGFVKDIKIENEKAEIFIEIPSNNEEVAEKIKHEIKAKLGDSTTIHIKTPQVEEEKKKTKNIAPNIKYFIMISSGKGGVGKSTTSANLAIALAQSGKNVGLLDADIYGPNIPRMLGLSAQKPLVDESVMKLIPLKAYGIKVMSMGMMYEEGQSLIWRGPMIMRAIEQMLTDVLWGNLDILVIDMPPGTGDAQLTLAQSVPISAGISVTTPQVVALDDSARSLDMFKKLNIPIAGIIENMSGFVCPNCNENHDIFGKNTAINLAKEYDTSILAQIPIDGKIRRGGDLGKPIVFFEPTSIGAKEYMQAAYKINEFLGNIGEVTNADIQPTRH